jgi:hypothetical protein
LLVGIGFGTTVLLVNFLLVVLSLFLTASILICS